MMLLESDAYVPPQLGTGVQTDGSEQTKWILTNIYTVGAERW